MIKSKQSSATGFTLIELLVVIAIISLLVSILLPSLSRAKELAKRVICVSNMKNCGLAIFTYLNENDSFFPIRVGWSYYYRWPEPPASYISPEDKYWDDYVNLGLLIEGGYLLPDFTFHNSDFPQPDHPLSSLLFCPSGTQKVVHQWPGNKEYVLYDSYWYLQPYRHSSGDSLQVDDMPTGVLMSDYMCGRNGYVSGFHHGKEGLNALFKDSSARWIEDNRLYDHLDFVKDNSSFGITWNAIALCWEYLDEES